MKFSIVCLTYKRYELLEESIYSVLQQTYKNWELLIINDYDLQTLYYNHPQIRIFNLKEKFKTISDKRNFGLDNITGDLVLQLDDDDFLLPSYLENLKFAIKDADWLSVQRPIIYYNDINKIFLSPVPQTGTFLYNKNVAKKIRYYSDNDNANELNLFYKNVEQVFKGYRIRMQLKPDQCGYVWRQDVDDKRKYSLANLLKKNIPQNEWDSLLIPIEDKVGEIVLQPKWSKDYVTIIKNNIKIIDPIVAYSKTKEGQDIFKMVHKIINDKSADGVKILQETAKHQIELEKKKNEEWQKVKPSWSNAVKFVSAMKSRGVISTVLDATGLDKTSGDRISDEIFIKRKLSCFGDESKKINSCPRLRYIDKKGYFCGGCGCGNNDLARLDADTPTEYTKLHYPQLECPLKKPGFSNHKSFFNVSNEKNPLLSIIIPVLNDNEELNLTIKSIKETSPKNVEIIVIDDASDVPVKLEDNSVKFFGFKERKGAGQARHMGSLNASSKHLLFIDSHMRFTKDWFDNAMNHIWTAPKTLWCGTCLGLDSSNMDVNNPKGSYNGANFVIYQEKNNVIFDGVWRKDEKDKDDYEISCVMGACYFIHKDWYFYIKGLEKTTMWGSEEPILSVKTWLADGEVKLMKSVRIGHKFRDAASYTTQISHVYYNKLAYMYMLFPTDLYEKIKLKFNQNDSFKEALRLVENNKLILDNEKKYYSSIFKHDIYWLCDRFDIKI